MKHPEEILGKLKLLSLNNNQKAIAILFDFENYFNYVADGAVLEDWLDALHTVRFSQRKRTPLPQPKNQPRKLKPSK